ncbi:hypothetical protein B0H13DRAFT_1873316 [Mycena leptocephala]|nr:hypothetical protein B0H13DRAFT_1873316 [Mycena leptocephala]
MTALNQVLDRYFYLTGVVLLIYDHLLTLQSEVRYIWTTEHTRGLAWYLLVRYFALCANVTIFALSFVDFSVKELMIGSRTPPRYLHSSHFKAATLILRVLAMYSFEKRVMASLACAAIIVICLFIRAAVGSEPPYVDRTNLSGCYSISSNARFFPIRDRRGMGRSVRYTHLHLSTRPESLADLPRTFSVLDLPYTEATPVVMMRPYYPGGLYGAF